MNGLKQELFVSVLLSLRLEYCKNKKAKFGRAQFRKLGKFKKCKKDQE